MIRIRAALALALLLMPSAAHAGLCNDDAARQNIANLETFAQGKSKEPEIWGLCIDQSISGSKKLTARFLAVCEKITAKDPDNKQCVRWSVELGAKTLGSLDLFDAVTKLFGLDPFKPGDIAISLYAKLDDARAIPLVRKQWEVSAADKRASSNKNELQYEWTVWRHSALTIFKSRGTPDDLEFLEAQAKATKDRGVRKAIANAVALIKVRATKPAAP